MCALATTMKNLSTERNNGDPAKLVAKLLREEEFHEFTVKTLFALLTDHRAQALIHKDGDWTKEELTKLHNLMVMHQEADNEELVDGD